MRLFANGEYLDQYEDTDIAQTFSANQIGDIGARSGSLSNNMKLPLTSHNRETLGFPDDLNTANRSAYQKVDADLIDGSETIRGYLKYKIVSIDSNEIQCTFFSSNSSWISDIKEFFLKDLNLSRFNHDWEYNTIADRIESDPDEGYAYQLIEYGEFADTTSVFTIEVGDNQLFPSTFVHTIVSQIYNDIGWTVGGELFDDPTFKRMVIPFSDSDFVLSQTQIDASRKEEGPFDAVNVSGFGTVTIPIGGVTDFAPDVVGVYSISTLIRFTVTTTGKINIVLQGGGQSKTVAYNYNTTGEKVAIITITGAVYDTLTPDTKVQMTPNGVGIDLDTTGGIIEWKRIPSNIVSGFELDLAGTLPKMKQSDFMKYIFFSFGIIPQTNNKNKSVRLDFFKSVKDNIKIADDWSNKVDLSRKDTNDFTKILKKYGTESVMEYKNDDDDPDLTAYLNQEGNIYGTGILDIDNEFIKESKTIYKSPFSPMFTVARFVFGTLETNHVPMPQIPFYTLEDSVYERTIAPKPRIGILTKNINIADYVGFRGSTENWFLNINESEGAGTRELEEMPFCYFTKPFINQALDVYQSSLAYELPDQIGIAGVPLKSRYLMDYQTIISSMKYLKIYILLNEVDIAELDFTIPKYISSKKAYFYVSKITNYRGANQSTLCELVKIS